MCQGPEVGACRVCLRKSEEARVDGAEGGSGWMGVRAEG